MNAHLLLIAVAALCATLAVAQTKPSLSIPGRTASGASGSKNSTMAVAQTKPSLSIPGRTASGASGSKNSTKQAKSILAKAKDPSILDGLLTSVKSSIGTMLGNGILQNLKQSSALLTQKPEAGQGSTSTTPNSAQSLTSNGQGSQLSYITFDATKERKSMSMLGLRVWNPMPPTTPVATAKVCKPGKFSPSMGASCQQCPAGTYSPGGSAPCVQCTAGTYSPDGSASCVKCPSGKYSDAGHGQCTACLPGTYSNTTGASSCSRCDLNFALAHQSGMDHCSLCPDGGAARNSNSCFRKVEAACDVAYEGFESAKMPIKMCSKTIDKNIETVGKAGDRKFLIRRKLVSFPTFFRYKFASPIRLRRIAIWHKPGQKELKNLKIVYSNKYTCLVDGVREKAASTSSYTFINYCESNEVSWVEVKNWMRGMRHFSISEIAFYAD